MLTITKEFLKACPMWKKAGWKVGDKVDMCTIDDEAMQSVARHPPKRPGG
jgi:hypothetical protein